MKNLIITTKTNQVYTAPEDAHRNKSDVQIEQSNTAQLQQEITAIKTKYKPTFFQVCYNLDGSITGRFNMKLRYSTVTLEFTAVPGTLKQLQAN